MILASSALVKVAIDPLRMETRLNDGCLRTNVNADRGEAQRRLRVSLKIRNAKIICWKQTWRACEAPRSVCGRKHGL